MVIQRIQTLYLIIAIALMTAFFFMPFGYTQFTDAVTGSTVEEPLKGIMFIGLIIPISVCLLTLVLAIFTFKSPSIQKLMVIISALLVGACVGVVIYILSGGLIDENPEYTTRTLWGGGGLLLIATWCALGAAYHGISADQRLLRSYDRIR